MYFFMIIPPVRKVVYALLTRNQCAKKLKPLILNELHDRLRNTKRDHYTKSAPH